MNFVLVSQDNIYPLQGTVLKKTYSTTEMIAGVLHSYVVFLQQVMHTDKPNENTFPSAKLKRASPTSVLTIAAKYTIPEQDF